MSLESSGVYRDTVTRHVECGAELVDDDIDPASLRAVDVCDFAGFVDIAIDSEIYYAEWKCPACAHVTVLDWPEDAA